MIVFPIENKNAVNTPPKMAGFQCMMASLKMLNIKVKMVAPKENSKCIFQKRNHCEVKVVISRESIATLFLNHVAPLCQFL